MTTNIRSRQPARSSGGPKNALWRRLEELALGGTSEECDFGTDKAIEEAFLFSNQDPLLAKSPTAPGVSHGSPAVLRRTILFRFSERNDLSLAAKLLVVTVGNIHIEIKVFQES
jgi:hypothetical protein